jgi:hypothetical protein
MLEGAVIRDIVIQGDEVARNANEKEMDGKEMVLETIELC